MQETCENCKFRYADKEEYPCKKCMRGWYWEHRCHVCYEKDVLFIDETIEGYEVLAISKSDFCPKCGRRLNDE